MPTKIPLWAAAAPGAVAESSRAQEAAGLEQPHLVPFLLGGRARAAVIVCPGGGYGTRAAHEGDPVARWLNALGINAFVLHYRHAPFRHPVPLHDAQRAIRLIRSRFGEWGCDPSRLGIIGFSAGGHLACSAANFGDEGQPESADAVERESSQLQGCIACYPVITFGEHRHHGSMVNLLGEDPHPALRRRMSLELSVSARNPPSFVWISADDQAVSVHNAILYAEALIAALVPVALHVYPHAPHGIGLGFDFPGSARTWTQDCSEWLSEVGFR